MCLCEEQCLFCANQLSQWDALANFGKSVENDGILLHSPWNCLALHDKNTSDVGDVANMVGKGVDLALEQWWNLPEMFAHSRIPLLQQFQQIVEVQESCDSNSELSPLSSLHRHYGCLGLQVVILASALAKSLLADLVRLDNVYGMTVGGSAFHLPNHVHGLLYCAMKLFQMNKKNAIDFC
ncbi:hypothetical protein VNO77_30907 [Canavalia gladiata]|uniref:PIK-related kinase FAT domain-containing protein n=1 Tax=Canavalia gladiata TaxID=3824 RepID=A0AAN9KNU4_CANGL